MLLRSDYSKNYAGILDASLVKVVRSKSSDKHESSPTLRVALHKSWHRLIQDRLVVRTLPTVSM